MASGKPLLGVPIVGGPHRVWLWNLEDPYDEMEKSIEAARQFWGLTPDDLGDRLLMNVAADGDALRLATIGEAGFQMDKALFGWIAGELMEGGIDYFHFDPFVSAHGLDENSNTEIDQLAKALSMLAHQTNTAIGLSHHTSKSGSVNVTTHSSRGAVSLTDACRSVITLNRMNDAEAEGYGIESKEARRYFCTYQDKGNRSAAADKVSWFQWKSVDLGNGRDGKESDSVGAVAQWTPPDAFENVSVDHLRRVQAAIADGEYKHHYAAADWVGNAIAPIVNLSASKKSDRTRLQTMIATWIEHGALKVESRKDANRQVKKYVVVGRSPDDHSATVD